MSYLSYDICKWLDALVFSEQDDKLQAPSPGFSLYWLTGNVKESSQFSQKVGNAAPGFVVWPCFQKWKKLEAPAKFLLESCELLNAALIKFSPKGCKSHQRISISLLLSLSLLKIQSFQWYSERWLHNKYYLNVMEKELQL